MNAPWSMNMLWDKNMLGYGYARDTQGFEYA